MRPNSGFRTVSLGEGLIEEGRIQKQRCCCCCLGRCSSGLRRDSHSVGRTRDQAKAGRTWSVGCLGSDGDALPKITSERRAALGYKTQRAREAVRSVKVA